MERSSPHGSSDLTDINLDDIKSIESFTRRYPDYCPSRKALYADISQSKSNGLDDCGVIIREGRRVFIVVPRYLSWLLRRGGRS